PPAPGSLLPPSLHDALPISPWMRVPGARPAHIVRSLADRSARDSHESASSAETGAVVPTRPAALGSTPDARGKARDSGSVLALPDRKSTRLNSSQVSISYAD